MAIARILNVGWLASLMLSVMGYTSNLAGMSDAHNGAVIDDLRALDFAKTISVDQFGRLSDRF